MTESADNSQSKDSGIGASRAKLLTLIAIAFGPILLAYMAYLYFPEWAPTSTTNQGELILPPVSAADIGMSIGDEDHWALVLPVSGSCDEDCQQMLYLSRQVVTGLGKNTNRVSRYVLAETEIDAVLRAHLNAEHPEMRVIRGDTAPLEAVNAATPLLFLVDPNGNVMMYYTLEKAGKPMLKDLKHLLKLSNIG